MPMSDTKPKIRFKGFTDPWEQRKVGDFLSISRIPGHTGVDAKKLTVKLWGKGVVEKDDSNKGSENTQYFIRTAGQFMYGKLDFLHAAFGIVPENLNNYESTLDLPAFDISGIDSQFLLNRVTQENFYLRYGMIANGSRKAKRIHEDVFLDMTLVVPKYKEQVYIGNLFKNLDNLITLHQRKCEMLQKTKKALLEKMFPQNGSAFPEVRFKGFTEAWEQRELGKIGTTFTGLSGKSKEDFGHGDARFITYMNVFTNAISTQAMTENVEIDNRQNEVKYGDVFFTTSSETPEEVGMSSIWLFNTPKVYLNSFCFGYRPNIKLDPYYLAFMLRSPGIRKKFTFLAQGISRYNISKNKVMEMTVPIPDNEEQKRVGEFFYAIDNLITLHQRAYEALKQMKQALLQKMFV
jgi:type I restriction enzyme S subunit